MLRTFLKNVPEFFKSTFVNSDIQYTVPGGVFSPTFRRMAGVFTATSAEDLVLGSLQ
jgi:hypothetical protein